MSKCEGECAWGLGEVCMGRRVPGVCGDPRYEKAARQQAGPLATPPAGEGPIVSWLAPSCYLGGAERQSEILMRATAGRVRWGYYGVWSETHVSEPMRSKVNALAPILYGTCGINQVYRHSDVVLRWGYDGDEWRPPHDRRCKTVYISHGCGAYTARVFRHPEDVDGVVAVSEASLGPLPKWARDRAVVIPNGIDLDALKPAPGAREELRTLLGVPDDERLVLWLGRFSDEKGPRLWVRSMAALERRDPGRWAFVACGSGDALAPCRRLARELGANIAFLGARQEVGDLLAASDTLAMTSSEEGDSLAALEAMASGLPIVTTRVGRAVEAGYKRLYRLTPHEPAPEDVAAALIADRDDPHGTASRAAQAREIAVARHSAAAMAGRWTDYLSTLGGAR